MHKLNIKTIVFDFDGTIVDSMGKLADLAADIISRDYDMSWDVARENYVRTSGIPFHEQLEVIFPNDSKNKKSANEFETSKKNWYINSPLFTDTISSLKNLKKKGYKIAVSSNNFQDMVESVTNKHNLSVDMALGYKSETFNKGKPHFTHINEKLNCTSDTVLFVGDSLKDGDRAKSCGVKFVAKTGLFSEKDFKNSFPDSIVINSLSDLEKLL